MAKAGSKGFSLVHWGRFFMAFFALLIAAAHLSAVIPSASFPAPAHQQPNSTAAHQQPHTGPTQGFGFMLLGFWLDIEIVAYTLIAVVFLLGLRTWYVPATLFNAFNVCIYFLSGVMAIPGITSGAFGSHLAVFAQSLPTTILVVSWIAALVLSLAMLKYDPGSELDALLVTRRKTP